MSGHFGVRVERRADFLQSPKQPLRFTPGASFGGGRLFEEALTRAFEYAFELREHHLLCRIHGWGCAHTWKQSLQWFCSNGSMEKGVWLAFCEESVS